MLALRKVLKVMEPSLLSPRVRFGAFEVDLQTGELFKHSRKVKLQTQSFLILASLLASDPSKLPFAARGPLRLRVNKRVNERRESREEKSAGLRFASVFSSNGSVWVFDFLCHETKNPN